jgi:hypothetical protein
MWQITGGTANACNRHGIACYGRSAGAAMAGNTGLRTGWTRFQKTADYDRIANRVPLAAMIRWPRLQRSLVIAVVPIRKG